MEIQSPVKDRKWKVIQAKVISIPYVLKQYSYDKSQPKETEKIVFTWIISNVATHLVISSEGISASFLSDIFFDLGSVGCCNRSMH